jgi:hypothetical protein
MVCVLVPLLLKRNNWVLFGVLRCARSEDLLWFRIVVMSGCLLRDGLALCLLCDTEDGGDAFL